MNIQLLAIISAALATLISFLSTPLVIRLAWKLKLIDDPHSSPHPKKIHKKPIPRAGGLATYIGVLIPSLIFLPLDTHLFSILLGITILLFLGLADDKYDINPYIRLAILFLAALFPIAAGIGISFVSNPFGSIINLPPIVANLFAILWIVTIMNFLNWGAKGVPGQLPGVTVIAATTIAILSLKFSADITQWPVALLASITAGSYLGFLPYNTHPQRIMPGFSSSTIAGFLLATLSILSTSKVGTLLIVLGIPLIDSGYTIIRRLLSGKSPIWGDRGHLHHRLLDSGMSLRQISYFYWFTALLLGILALNLKALGKLYTMVVLILLIGGLILWLTYKPKKTSRQ